MSEQTQKKSGIKSFIHNPLVAKIVLTILATAVIAVVVWFIITRVSSTSASTLAVVNGEKITQSEYDMLAQQFSMVAGGSLDDAQRGALLEQLVNQKLWLQDAVSNGLSVSESEVETELANIQQEFTTQQPDISFDETLDQYGMNMDQLRESLQEDLLLQKYVASLQIGSDIAVPEEDVRAYYDQLAAGQGEDVEVPAYEEVQEQIASSLAEQQVGVILQQKAQELRAEANIKINEVQ
jgi:hypothetical protein